MINPAFQNRKDELALIGEMVVGYGELDISFSLACGIALKHQWAVLDACHQVRSETARLDIACALGKEAFEQLALQEEFVSCERQLRRCLKIRNQYAHSQWADDLDGGLKFMNPDNAFERPLKPTDWKAIDLMLLERQRSFFENTRAWILWLEFATRSQEMKRPIDVKKPPEMPQPNLHNPAPQPARGQREKGSRGQPK